MELMKALRYKSIQGAYIDVFRMFSADIALVDSGNGILLRRVNKGGKKEKGERLFDSQYTYQRPTR